MGTLLSFIAYAENPGQITGIVAIDSPLHVSVKWLAIKNNLKIGFSKKISENDPAQALLHASSVSHMGTENNRFIPIDEADKKAATLRSRTYFSDSCR